MNPGPPDSSRGARWAPVSPHPAPRWVGPMRFEHTLCAAAREIRRAVVSGTPVVGPGAEAAEPEPRSSRLGIFEREGLTHERGAADVGELELCLHVRFEGQCSGLHGLTVMPVVVEDRHLGPGEGPDLCRCSGLVSDRTNVRNRARRDRKLGDVARSDHRAALPEGRDGGRDRRVPNLCRADGGSRTEFPNRRGQLCAVLSGRGL
jgi:hypothetical protein